MCSSSSPFQPGTKVQARPPQQGHLWRRAQVVEPSENQPPQTVTVKFVGKTDKVVLPLTKVKLLPHNPNGVIDRPSDTIDLTSGVEDDQPAIPSQVQLTISDPYNASSNQSTTPHQPAGQPVSAPVADPVTDAPHIQPRSEETLQQSVPENTKQSSRDWLLAQSSTQSDRNHVTAQSDPSFRPPQRQPQVVRDPSFPPSRYSSHPHPRGNPRPLSWDAAHNPPVDVERNFSFPAGHDEDFAPYAPRAHSPGFQFTVVRTDPGPSSQALPPPLSRPPQNRRYAPSNSATLREAAAEVYRPVSTPWPTTVDPQVTSNSRSALSQGSSNPVLSIRPRNGLIPRNPDRHPERSVDENLRIPRTTAAQRLPTERHPQDSFDDDVPIPRNVIPRRVATNAVYPASKRPRVSYSEIVHDQMPPPSEAENGRHRLSRRLAKRERESGWNHGQGRRESHVVQSLPYQQPLQRENDIVKIAPHFDSSQELESSSKKASDVETKFLEEVFADLSMSCSDVDMGSRGTGLPKTRSKAPSIAVRGGGRKKSHPKRLRRSHLDERREEKASSGFNFFESGICRSSVQGQVAASSNGPLNSITEDHNDLGNCPMPRVYGCSCQHGSEENRPICNETYSIQCCICMLWSHMRCIGFEPEELRAFRERAASGAERYICIPCLDEYVSSGSATGSHQRHISSNVFHDGAKWTSSVHTASQQISGFSIITADMLLHSNLARDRRVSGCAWIREPLVQDEISARVNNLERLREGVMNASVGTRERALFDELLGDQRHQLRILE